MSTTLCFWHPFGCLLYIYEHRYTSPFVSVEFYSYDSEEKSPWSANSISYLYDSWRMIPLNFWSSPKMSWFWVKNPSFHWLSTHFAMWVGLPQIHLLMQDCHGLPSFPREIPWIVGPPSSPFSNPPFFLSSSYQVYSRSQNAPHFFCHIKFNSRSQNAPHFFCHIKFILDPRMPPTFFVISSLF